LFESAYNKLNSLLSSQLNKTLRITLEPGGCAGLSYKAMLDTPTENDKVITFDETVKIVVSDKKRFPADDDPSLLFSDWDFLDGLHLKFEESIMSSHFVMDNPNAQRGCSCGISFKPKGYGGKPKSCH
jgi:iron-sulfur cluster assembly accessory protein